MLDLNSIKEAVAKGLAQNKNSAVVDCGVFSCLNIYITVFSLGSANNEY